MKTIYKGKDDLYYVVNITGETGTPLVPSDLDALTIEFFTDGSALISFDAEDLTEEGVLHVDASKLEDLTDGPLKARFHIALADSGFEDGKFDTVTERATGYFLKTLKEPDNHEV